MTAGMTTRTIEGSRVSLPRAGFGALLAGTLLAGTLLGAAAYAGIEAATTTSAAIVAPLPHEPAAVHHLRIAAGNGQLVGDTPGFQAAAAASLSDELPVVRIARIAAGNGQLEGDAPGTPAAFTNSSATPRVNTGHAPGHGPLE